MWVWHPFLLLRSSPSSSTHCHQQEYISNLVVAAVVVVVVESPPFIFFSTTFFSSHSFIDSSVTHTPFHPQRVHTFAFRSNRLLSPHSLHRQTLSTPDTLLQPSFNNDHVTFSSTSITTFIFPASFSETIIHILHLTSLFCHILQHTTLIQVYTTQTLLW